MKYHFLGPSPFTKSSSLLEQFSQGQPPLSPTDLGHSPVRSFNQRWRGSMNIDEPYRNS